MYAASAVLVFCQSACGFWTLGMRLCVVVSVSDVCVDRAGMDTYL